ncbi:MAG: sugar phosphate isomerase/epimerase [Candidatus Poribacteria bacterium]|nr:sugar phosphate isomerase/epimerase [Candidatus Poribacteria bacterium]|tara:strand:- start:799 stop:1554 length:756 start_codon:yes stop_codon:yes gene_type:complete
MANIPIALELYSVRNELVEDTAGTLKAVAEMGYVGVEFAGHPNNTAQELRTLLDDLGIVCCGWHTPIDLVQDDKLSETIEFNQILGNSNIIIPGIPQHMRETREDWLKMAEFFNQLAEKLASHDMATGYHNHHIEFEELGGELPWDTFFGNTNSEVIMQLDTGNAFYGGAELLSIFERYPNRAITVHLKPYSKTDGFRPLIGDDDVPWLDVFKACETNGGTEWYIVEYESDLYEPLESVERCLKNLKAMGK